jgi:hypothetical protein
MYRNQEHYSDPTAGTAEKALMPKVRRSEPMRQYNDYIATTRRWLKNYNKFKVSVENMEQDIKDHERALQMHLDMGAPIAKYGDSPGGGTPELNAVESSADIRIKREKAILRIRENALEIQHIIDKLDRSIAELADEDRTIVTECFIERKSWLQIGRNHHYSEKWARDR